MFCYKCESIMDIESESKIINQDVKTCEDFLKFYDKNKNDLSYSIKSEFTREELDNLLTSKKNKNKKKILDFFDKVSNIKNNSYNNICYKCNSVFVLQKGTVLYRNLYVSNKKNINISHDIDNLINCPFLPRSKDYICQNNSCTSHKDKLIDKEAVIYRYDDTYITFYICTICKYYWNPIIDKNQINLKN